MSRITRCFLACAVVAVLVSVAAAQQKPEPVVRIGDWVEIGNEAFMNIIGAADIRYRATHNLDFDGDVRDRANSRDPFSTSNHDQEFDGLYTEARWGADFRYQKNFRFQILFEWQGTLDGNLIDDRHNLSSPNGTDIFGRPAVTEDESTNLERVWMEYKFEGTPVRLLVGADLWFSDQAGLLGDDDPRFALYLDLPDGLEIGAWAVLQTSSHRLGLQNDHDFWYYVFHASYKGAKPHVFALDAAYFRDRATGAPNCANAGCAATATAPAGAPGARVGEKHDAVLIMPSWSGTFGIISAMVQGNVLFGSADSNTVTDEDYDIFAWGIVASIEAKLGIVTPFLGFIMGSGDDDSGDNDLNGFMTLPQGEITLSSATRWFDALDRTFNWGRDVVTPARATGPFAGTQEFSHTVSNPFNDRLGTSTHAGITSTYSNPGTLVIPAGVKIFPVKGHEIDLVYLYRGMLKSDILEDALGVSIGNTLYHEIFAQWQWTLNRHFDIRLSGSMALPGGGADDIAETSTATATGAPGSAAGCPCDGGNPALQGEARFRARF